MTLGFIEMAPGCTGSMLGCTGMVLVCSGMVLGCTRVHLGGNGIDWDMLEWRWNGSGVH